MRSPPFTLFAGLSALKKILITLKLITMKAIILKTSFIFLFPLVVGISLMGTGCEKEDVSQSVLDGKWILTGFGDDSSNKFIPEPESEPQSSYVVFNNGELVAHSVTNRTFDIKYLIKEGNKLSITPGIMTLVGSDTEWGQKFLSLISTIYEFERNGDELKLYYEDQKFMKLKKETK